VPGGGPPGGAWKNGRMTLPQAPARTDVLVVGAGPAGAAAAAWAARGGRDVVLADAAVFPRDKTCGDGLTPRAIAELQLLGQDDWVRAHTTNRGLRAHGFGQTLLLPWPGGSLPDYGSAVPRTVFDDHLRTTAMKSGAVGVDGARAVDVRRDGARVAAVVFQRDGERFEIGCEQLVVADGVRSPLGKMLGREWHRETAYGVARRLSTPLYRWSADAVNASAGGVSCTTSAPGTELAIARRSYRALTPHRNEESVHPATAAATGPSRSGRYENVSPLGPKDVWVNSWPMVADASGLFGAYLLTLSLSDSHPSDAQRTASEPTNAWVVPSSTLVARLQRL